MQQLKKATSFTEGPLFFKIVKFVIPIMLTGILQVVYNMADNIVVGKFSGDEYALGAVGSASAMTNLTINLLIGLSVGAGTGLLVLFRNDVDKIECLSLTGFLFAVSVLTGTILQFVL